MQLFENITIEQVILSLAVAVAATEFVSISTQLGSASWRWALHFITTTRRQRRHENYVEVRRRIRSEAYLLYKDGRAKDLMVPVSIMNFGVLLALLLNLWTASLFCFLLLSY